jgi:predicted ATPase
MARLDQLPVTAKEVIQAAAVIGREFTRNVLARVCRHDQAGVDAALDRLVSARLIVKGGLSLDALSFRHALIQDAAYQSLLKSKRQQYHEAIARALIESQPETVRMQPELVAYHFTEAGIAEQAVPFWQRAGERALARSANYESVDHFKHAIEHAVKLEDANDRSRTLLAARMSLGQAQRAAGHLS